MTEKKNLLNEKNYDKPSAVHVPRTVTHSWLGDWLHLQQFVIGVLLLRSFLTVRTSLSFLTLRDFCHACGNNAKKWRTQMQTPTTAGAVQWHLLNTKTQCLQKVRQARVKKKTREQSNSGKQILKGAGKIQSPKTTTNVQKSTRSKTGKKAGTRYNDEPAKNEGKTHLNTLGRAG